MAAAFSLDLGTQNSTLCEIVRSGVDVILNEASKRSSPTLVSFGGNERYIGEAAVTQIRTNMDNTVTQLKRLLGRKFSEPGVVEDIATHLNYRITQLPNDDIGIEVAYNGGTRVFSPTQVLAAFFTKIKAQIRTKYPAVTTPDIVISVPAYYTDAQRHAVRDAAAIAGLNCLRTLNEGTAAALSYGIFKSAKKEFPDVGASRVLLLDMGAGHFSATVASFTNSSLKVLASVSDDGIGGRELDAAIARHFAAEFKAATGLDAWANRKARVKLLVAAEKAKIAVTPYGVNVAPVSVECLLNDRDYATKFTVEKLDELAAPCMARMQAAIRRALADAGVAGMGDLLAAELVGGSMRTRVAKRAAAEALGLPLNEETGHGLSTSLNLEEAVARGAAVACAMLSPHVRVKDFEIVDRVCADVVLCWDAPGARGATPAAAAAAPGGMDVDDEGGDGAGGGVAADASSVKVFSAGDAAPLQRKVTFRRPGPITLTLEYDAAATSVNVTGGAVPRGHPAAIARYRVELPLDAAPAADEPHPRVRVDVKVDIHGCVSVERAGLLKEIKEAGAAGDAAAANAAAAAAATGGDADAAAAAAAAAKPKRFKRVEAYVRAEATFAMERAALSAAAAEEAAMAAQDADIHATQDTRNTLETTIYSTRGSLEEALGKFATPGERDAAAALCGSLEEWLYDNFDATRATYEAKLKELRAVVAPLAARKWESENRYDAIENLAKAIDDFRGVATNRSGKHAHLSDSDRDTLRAATSEAESWLKARQAEQAQLEQFQDPAVRVAEVETWRAKLNKELGVIANKPVPAPVVTPPPPAASPPPPAAPGAGTDEGAQAPPPAPTEDAAAPPPAVPPMDVE